MNNAPAEIQESGNAKQWVVNVDLWRTDLEDELKTLKVARELDQTFLKETDFVPVMLYDAVRYFSGMWCCR